MVLEQLVNTIFIFHNKKDEIYNADKNYKL